MEAENEPGREATPGRKYWEIISEQIAAEGWSYGFVKYEQPGFEGWKVEARKEEQVHQVIAEDLNTAFTELQASLRRVA